MPPIDSILPLTLAAFDTRQLIPAAGILFLITGMLIYYRKRRRIQAARPALDPQEQLERNRQLRGVRGDLESLMVEIEQFSKRLAAQLDAKTAALELSIKQADQRIAELKRLAGADKGSGNGGGGGEGEGHDPHDAHPQRGPRPSGPMAPADLPDDPLSRSVYQLADQGLDPQAISQRLSEHVGKIELILALRSA